MVLDYRGTVIIGERQTRSLCAARTSQTRRNLTNVQDMFDAPFCASNGSCYTSTIFCAILSRNTSIHHSFYNCRQVVDDNLRAEHRWMQADYRAQLGYIACLQNLEMSASGVSS